MKEKMIEEIKRIYSLSGETHTDRECLDMMWAFLEDKDEEIDGLWFLLNTPMEDGEGQRLDEIIELIKGDS